jgi:hypothetical protein
MELKIKQTKDSEEKVVNVECFEEGGDIVLMVDGFYVFALTSRGYGALYRHLQATDLQVNKHGVLVVKEV